MKAVINSIKHYVHVPVNSIASGARGTIILADTVVAPAAANANEVREGSRIKAIYLEMWVSNDGNDTTLNGMFGKLVNGNAVPTFTEFNNMGSFVGKNNIFEFHQGLGPAQGNVIPMFRGWLKIPKGKQRMALGDQLFCGFSYTGNAGQFCGFTTYKEYY